MWVFHDVDPGVMASGFRRVSWPLAAVAVVADMTAFVCQGWRWKLLLRPYGAIGVRDTTTAVYAGLFTNEVLPLRMGELVRSYLVARRLAVDLLTVLASVAVERLFDGLWLALAVGLVALMVPLPPELVRIADILGAFVLVAALVFVLLIVWTGRRGSVTVTEEWAGGRFLARAAGALRTLGSTRGAAAAFVVSSGVLAFQLIAFWLMLEGYGISLPLPTGVAVMVIVMLGTAIPNAPGNVGSYQLFCVLGLTLFGVDKPRAAGFSVVVFVLLTIPLWVLGALALNASGESLFGVRREVFAALRSARSRRAARREGETP